MSGGTLLRLFQSEYFDAHLHMHYLHRMEQSGVQDYLVNELYKMTDHDVDFYLPQLCQIALLRFHKSSLHRFLLDKAAQSMPFALKIHWLVLSIVEDRQSDLLESAMAMLNMCEAALVNSALLTEVQFRYGHQGASPGRTQRCQRSSSDPDLQAVREVPQLEVSHKTHRRSKTLTQFSQRPRPEPLASDAESASLGFDPPSSPSNSEQLLRMPSEDSQAVASPAPSPSAARGLRHTALRHLLTLSRDCSPEQRVEALGLFQGMPNTFLELGQPVPHWLDGLLDEDTPTDDMRHVLMKQRRCEYFNLQSHLVSMVMKLSTALAAMPEKTERPLALSSTLHVINRWLLDRRIFMVFGDEGPLHLLGLHIPVHKNHDNRQQILTIHVEQCKIFSSATRAPFRLVYETANLDEDEREDVTPKGGTGAKEAKVSPLQHTPPLQHLAQCVVHDLLFATRTPSASSDDPGLTPTPSDPDPHQALWKLLAHLEPAQWRTMAARVRRDSLRPAESAPSPDAGSPAEEKDRGRPSPLRGRGAEALRRSEQALQTRLLIWGESWKERAARIRGRSPYGHYHSWGLHAVMVKGGDDLRQELLASQIIEQFGAIFHEAGLPLWVRPTRVLVTSSNSGFIEFLHDSTSVDAMKKLFKDKPQLGLGEIFRLAFADNLFEAQKNFIESCAAYSLVIWFLQVKDRHNGNLLLLSSGHLVHIDFGFMLSNSPGGNIAFEQSPFKLTKDFLEVMGGKCSDQFEYFRTLVIRGFLEARKHMERIVLPIRMMLSGSKMPCFREGPDAVLQALQDRFFTNLTEEACIEKVVDLIDISLENWSSVAYDKIQTVLNGISA